MTIKTAHVRQSFLEFFRNRDHKLVPSSPVVPFDDPTILFANAGMNQFKDIFTGKRKSEFSRATSSQKCIRAGGKHNDLDNVGFTARHHTFFEMLGNFSFGDYFKEEAIAYAWEWVTKEMALPKDRLYATVYDDDDEAFALWEKIAPELKNGRIMRFGKHDNYWTMGDIGPCGPCSEIHYDRGEKYGTGPQDVVNGETERFTEIWNLVFMQFDQLPDGKVVPLPRPSVDTGAGLERITSIIQNVDSNYGIDIFQNLIAGISDITGCRYADNVTSHHVIADHIRALAFSIADGAGISNEGRGYVLRRILRRAARHGRNLGAHEPFLFKLVPVLVNEMGDAYPELREKQDHIGHVIKAEEESFGRTLETGLTHFDKLADEALSTGRKMIPGADVFRLYDTYGFPYDLTEVMAAERGLTLDQEGFETAMAAQQERSRVTSHFESHEDIMRPILEREGISEKPTEFVGYDTLQLSTKSILLYKRRSAEDPEITQYNVFLILDKTPFYVEAGGQIRDQGRIFNANAEIRVDNIYPFREYLVHEGVITRGTYADFERGQEVTAEVDADRRWDIMRNHTATHLAHKALRQVLGDHVKQSGSYVGPDRLRFDFSHHQPMTDEEIEEVERIVNEQILRGTEVATQEMPVEEAKRSGAMALFGEKYEDLVRVVSVGDFSKELCGGTHVQNVSQIGPFFIVQETGIASGVRRLEAVTGREAQVRMFEARKFRREVSRLIGRPESEALSGVEQLKENIGSLQKELRAVRESMFAGQGRAVGEETIIGPIHLWTHNFEATARDTMAAWIDSQKNSSDAALAIAFGTVNGRPSVVIAASPAAVREQKLHAGDMASEILPKLGGRGGGKPSFAQGSVESSTKARDLFQMVRGYLESKIGDEG